MIKMRGQNMKKNKIEAQPIVTYTKDDLSKSVMDLLQTIKDNDCIPEWAIVDGCSDSPNWHRLDVLKNMGLVCAQPCDDGNGEEYFVSNKGECVLSDYKRERKKEKRNERIQLIFIVVSTFSVILSIASTIISIIK